MKVLIVVTSVDIYESGNLPTGLWLSELTHFYHDAKAQEYDVVIASPQGGNTPIDPESLKPLLVDKLSKDFLNNAEFKQLLQNTKSLNEISEQQFDCIYLTGGHGTMYDFPENATLQRIIQKLYENNKVVAAVCHGVGGLLNVKLSNGEYLIKGKKITGYSWFEEILARRKKEVPFNLESELKKRNANYEKAFFPMTSNVCESGHLITGQNPFSSKAIAKAVMQRLKTQNT